MSYPVIIYYIEPYSFIFHIFLLLLISLAIRWKKLLLFEKEYYVFA